MIYVRPEEIQEVKKNLKIFDGKIEDRFIEDLLKSNILRDKKHGLFISLSHPVIFPLLRKSIVAVKKYNNGKYFAKTIRKLIKAADWLDHKSVVVEVLVVGYYFNKFQDNKNFEIVGEREINNKGSNVDISILGYKKHINIEITALHSFAKQRFFFDLRHKIKIALEQMAETFEDQKYAYIFSLPEGSTFSKKDIPAFIDFAKSMREAQGVGNYSFEPQDKTLIVIEIRTLNKRKKEYADNNIDLFSGSNEDWKRIQDKIAGKVAKQLPKGEINFVCIPAMDIWIDDYEAERAMFGTEKLVLNIKKEEATLLRESDNVAKIISEESYDSFYGLIFFNWDYSKKKIIGNPAKKYKGEVKEVVELVR